MSFKKLTSGLGILAASVALTGCLGGGGSFDPNIKPTDNPYGFVAKEPTLRFALQDLYPSPDARAQQLSSGTETFSALVRSPNQHIICFNGNSSGIPVPAKDDKGEEVALKFVNGVYPFEVHKLYKDSKGKPKNKCSELKKPKYIGAMAFFGYDQDMEFATFGADADTALISDQIISKVANGALGSHTISYDNKQRIKYWVGNRSALFSGGAATVEVDFRKANLKSLKINGEEVKNMQTELDIYVYGEDAAGRPTKKPKKHRLEFTTRDGKKFAGYLKDLQENEYTAFMKIPCDIPAELYDAASKGTVSKFDVMSKTERGSARLAQIVFGVKR